MRNPFRSEEDAYRLVQASVATFGGTLLAVHYLGGWGSAGVLALSAVVLPIMLRDRREEQPAKHSAHSRPRAHAERRILVVANETVGGETLAEEIRSRASARPIQVLVVCPALNSRLRHWVSDVGRARAAAERRLAASIDRLAAAGIQADGYVGDAEPLQAIDDALRTFGADEILISTHPPGRSHWLERDVTDRARRSFGLPVTHVVVDLAAESLERTASEDAAALWPEGATEPGIS